MTVSVLTNEAVTAVPSRDVHKPEYDKRSVPEPENNSYQAFPYAAVKTSYIHGKRRKTGCFGDVLFVQLILSVLLAAGVWAGNTFGGEEIKSLCAYIRTLFG